MLFDTRGGWGRLAVASILGVTLTVILSQQYLDTEAGQLIFSMLGGFLSAQVGLLWGFVHEAR